MDSGVAAGAGGDDVFRCWKPSAKPPATKPTATSIATTETSHRFRREGGVEGCASAGGCGKPIGAGWGQVAGASSRNGTGPPAGTGEPGGAFGGSVPSG